MQRATLAGLTAVAVLTVTALTGCADEPDDSYPACYGRPAVWVDTPHAWYCTTPGGVVDYNARLPVQPAPPAKGAPRVIQPKVIPPKQQTAPKVPMTKPAPPAPKAK